ncbi:MAG: hypothetical protein ACOYKZ_07635 [Chlamydiia bacterium]
MTTAVLQSAQSVYAGLDLFRAVRPYEVTAAEGGECYLFSTLVGCPALVVGQVAEKAFSQVPSGALSMVTYGALALDVAVSAVTCGALVSRDNKVVKGILAAQKQLRPVVIGALLCGLAAATVFNPLLAAGLLLHGLVFVADSKGMLSPSFVAWFYLISKLIGIGIGLAFGGPVIKGLIGLELVLHYVLGKWSSKAKSSQTAFVDAQLQLKPAELARRNNEQRMHQAFEQEPPVMSLRDAWGRMSEQGDWQVQVGDLYKEAPKAEPVVAGQVAGVAVKAWSVEASLQRVEQMRQDIMGDEPRVQRLTRDMSYAWDLCDEETRSRLRGLEPEKFLVAGSPSTTAREAYAGTLFDEALEVFKNPPHGRYQPGQVEHPEELWKNWEAALTAVHKLLLSEDPMERPNEIVAPFSCEKIDNNNVLSSQAENRHLGMSLLLKLATIPEGSGASCAAYEVLEVLDRARAKDHLVEGFFRSVHRDMDTHLGQIRAEEYVSYASRLGAWSARLVGAYHYASGALTATMRQARNSPWVPPTRAQHVAAEDQLIQDEQYNFIAMPCRAWSEYAYRKPFEQAWQDPQGLLLAAARYLMTPEGRRAWLESGEGPDQLAIHTPTASADTVAHWDQCRLIVQAMKDTYWFTQADIRAGLLTIYPETEKKDLHGLDRNWKLRKLLMDSLDSMPADRSYTAESFTQEFVQKRVRDSMGVGVVLTDRMTRELIGQWTRLAGPSSSSKHHDESLPKEVWEAAARLLARAGVLYRERVMSESEQVAQ